MLKDLHNAVFFNGNIVFFNADSDNVTFFGDDMDHVTVDLNNVRPDDDNFHDYDPETVTQVRLMT